MNMCSIQECERKHLAKGYCGFHYKRVKRHGEPGSSIIRSKIERCSATNCEQPHKARGLCSAHYQRLINNLELTKPFQQYHKHNLHKHLLYNCWLNMRQRCNSPNDKGYKNYGGRGITVCERWDNFANFVADMGERPEGMSLDRKDNNGNYEPGNVRWATPKEQANNRRERG